MTGWVSQGRSKTFKSHRYYVCGSKLYKSRRLRGCVAPYYSADAVDQAVWAWVESLITDHAILDKELRALQASWVERSSALRERLAQVEEQIGQQEKEQKALLDLYLQEKVLRTTWEAQNDELRRKHRALALEQATLKAKVEIGNMSEPQIQGLHEFASQTWAHFQPTSETLASKHRLFALLKLRVLLNMDGEGKRYAQVSCLSGPINGPVVPVSLIKKLELPPGLREQKYQAS